MQEPEVGHEEKGVAGHPARSGLADNAEARAVQRARRVTEGGVMIAAIYGRKSTEQAGADADAKSVARQAENARAFAATQRWTVAEDHVYLDDAVSGAEIRKLVARQRLIDVIASGRAPFGVLVMRDASRFSRRDGDEAFAELKAIAKAGIRIVFYQDGTEFAYGDFASNITGIVRAEMNAEFRRSIAKWTREAMIRKAIAGHVTGGRVFGYDNVRVNGHVERRVNPAEAAVVVKIFEMAAGGAGFKRIAKTLNDARLPCPRAQRNRPAGWGPTSVRPVIFRTIYRGVTTWGKTRKRNGAGEVATSRTPGDTWITTETPDTRIVSDELWQAANRRVRAAADQYLRCTRGRVFGRPAVGLGSKYLLTGFAVCGACHDPVRKSGLMSHSFTNGRQREFFYKCGGFHNKGRIACENGRRLPMREADAAVLDALRQYILHKDVVAGAIEDALNYLRPQVGALATRRQTLAADLRRVDAELQRLADAVAQGGQLQSLLKTIEERERSRAEIQDQIAALVGLENISKTDVQRIENDLKTRVREWRELLGRQIPIARQIVGKLIGEHRIEFVPQPTGEWTFSGQATLGKLLSGVVLPLGWRPHRESNPSLGLERAAS